MKKALLKKWELGAIVFEGQKVPNSNLDTAFFISTRKTREEAQSTRGLSKRDTGVF